MISGRRRSVIFFTVLGICLVALAVTLNISWIVLNWRRGVLAILGVIFFLLIIAGMVLNTIFLVREIRRNEQHDSFINAVTHELKTPVASIRLYLQTLQTRDLDEGKRREFYRIMLEDSDRLLQTIEQVLRAGSSGSRFRRIARSRVDLGEIARECVELARTRFHLDADALAYDERVRSCWEILKSSRRRCGTSSTTLSSIRPAISGFGSPWRTSRAARRSPCASPTEASGSRVRS
jgi:signal transduction histidine kinase